MRGNLAACSTGNGIISEKPYLRSVACRIHLALQPPMGRALGRCGRLPR
jgi:hypothetical protein